MATVLMPPTWAATIDAEHLPTLLYAMVWITGLLIIGSAIILGVGRWLYWQRNQPMRLAGRKGRGTKDVDPWAEAGKRIKLDDELGDEDEEP